MLASSAQQTLFLLVKQNIFSFQCLGAPLWTKFFKSRNKQCEARANVECVRPSSCGSTREVANEAQEKRKSRQGDSSALAEMA